jgi:hypothetical protein
MLFGLTNDTLGTTLIAMRNTNTVTHTSWTLKNVVTYELVLFEKQPVDAKDLRRFTDRFRGGLRIHLQLVEKS